jgi:hypothetical protein
MGDFVGEGQLEIGEQWQAIERAAEADEKKGETTMLALVDDESAPTGDRLAAAAKLAAQGRTGVLTPALVAIGSKGQGPDGDRLAAAALLAGYDPASGAELHARIAEDYRVFAPSRIAAADRIAEHDRAWALHLYLRIGRSGDYLEGGCDRPGGGGPRSRRHGPARLDEPPHRPDHQGGGGDQPGPCRSGVAHSARPRGCRGGIAAGIAGDVSTAAAGFWPSR